MKQPSTSLAAYESQTKEKLQRDHDKIKIALEEMGGNGTYDEIAAHLNANDPSMVSRRLKEMSDKGIIFRSEIKRKTRRDKDAYVWQLTGQEPLPASGVKVKIYKNKKIIVPPDKILVTSYVRSKPTKTNPNQINNAKLVVKTCVHNPELPFKF